MADEPLAQQLATLRSLLNDVDARLTRAPVLPAGLEDLKTSVDTLRTGWDQNEPGLAPAFDALLEWHAHKPFECVGEGGEARSALAALAARAEWREDALVARFRAEILPKLAPAELELARWLAPKGEHRIPDALRALVDAH